MPHVTFLPSSPTAAARLRAALSEEHRTIVVRDWNELLQCLRESSISACVIDMDYPRRAVSLKDLEMLRSEHRQVALVVYGRFEGRGLELFRLGKMGVDEIILADKGDTPEEIRRTVSRALARALASRVRESLEGGVPEFGLRCLVWAVEHAHEAPLVPDLAQALHTSRRTLSRKLRRLELPPGSRVLLWGRLLRAVQLLEDPDVTVEGVAYRIGYSSASALRRALLRETGLPPKRISKRGGIEWVLDCFVRDSARRRDARRRGVRWGRARDRDLAGGPRLDPYR